MLGRELAGTPELIDEGRTGYIVAAGSADELADKVIRHFRRPAWDRRRMRQACVQKARCELTYRIHLDQTQAVYAEVLA